MLGLSIVINYNIIVGFEGHNIFYGSFLLWAFRATVIFLKVKFYCGLLGPQ